MSFLNKISFSLQRLILTSGCCCTPAIPSPEAPAPLPRPRASSLIGDQTNISRGSRVDAAATSWAWCWCCCCRRFRRSCCVFWAHARPSRPPLCVSAVRSAGANVTVQWPMNHTDTQGRRTRITRIREGREGEALERCERAGRAEAAREANTSKQQQHPKLQQQVVRSHRAFGLWEPKGPPKNIFIQPSARLRHRDTQTENMQHAVNYCLRIIMSRPRAQQQQTGAKQNHNPLSRGGKDFTETPRVFRCTLVFYGFATRRRDSKHTHTHTRSCGKSTSSAKRRCCGGIQKMCLLLCGQRSCLMRVESFSADISAAVAGAAAEAVLDGKERERPRSLVF